jgi:hypothetical protein
VVIFAIPISGLEFVEVFCGVSGSRCGQKI